jgi:regulatory protein
VDAEEARARECGLRLLARRDHSSADLARKLRQRGFSAELIAGILTGFTEAGYLDDRRYAERWAESALASGRGYGNRLRLELQQRGVSRELAAEVAASTCEGHDETAALMALVERKFPGFDPRTAIDRERRRVYAHLQRRGFSASAIAGFFRGDLECL